MKGKKFKATYLINVEGSGEGDYHVLVTSQMVRDKMTSFLQEMYILHHLDGFSVREVKPQKVVSKFEVLERKNTKVRKRKYS